MCYLGNLLYLVLSHHSLSPCLPSSAVNLTAIGTAGRDELRIELPYVCNVTIQGIDLSYSADVSET